MSRRKDAALVAPATLEEAMAVIDNYAALSADVAAIGAERAVRRALVDKDCDERVAARTAQMKDLFGGLKVWWAVAGGEVAKGKRSTEIGPVLIGIRKTPSALKSKGKAADLVKSMLSAGLGRFLKVKHSLDKDAIKRVLAIVEPDGDTLLDKNDLTALGFTVGSKDEFFIQPLAEAKGDVEVSS